VNVAIVVGVDRERFTLSLDANVVLVAYYHYLALAVAHNL
jgi:hypothetical protein